MALWNNMLQGHRLMEEIFLGYLRDIIKKNKTYKKLDMFDLEPQRGHLLWDCPKSPVGICYYDRWKDKPHDHCIFCEGPEERK